MLSAFTARPIIELKSRDKSKIESVLSHGDRIFVGLNTGALRIYRVTEATPGHGEHEETLGSPRREVELLREEEKFSKRGVQQLAIVKEASVLIALSENYVSFYELDTYGLSERLQQTRGATCFATSRSIDREADSGIASIVSRMAVAVKRKILLWTWQDSELSGPPDELTLPATVKSIIWTSSTRIIAGMDPGFSLVDLTSQTISEINRASNVGEPGGPEGTRFGAINASGMGYMGMGGWVPKPLAAKLGENDTLLVKDINSLFIDSNGQAREKRQIPWTTAPESIGYSYPYLLALQPQAKGMLEVRNPDTLSLLQTVPMANASILHVPQPNISLAHAGKGFLVTSDRCIWRMDAIGYGSQLDALLAQDRYDEALSLANLIEDTLLLDKQIRVQSVKIEKAIWLFDRREYRQAMELFSEAPARPDQVVPMYPEVIAGDSSRFKDVPQRQDSSDAAESSPPQPSTPAKAEPVAATPKKGKGHGPGKNSETASIRSFADAERQTSVEDVRPLEGKDLNVAVNELRGFLAQTRVQLQKYINFDGTLRRELPGSYTSEAGAIELPDFAHFIDYNGDDTQDHMREKLVEVATLVDTTLFRAYMLVSPSLAGSLFRLDNFCAPEVVEESLYASGRYNELIDFLWGKKLHAQALELLEKFGRNEASEEAPEDFKGPGRTVRYLQQLPFEMIDMILQHAGWTLKADPDLGIQIFVADTENAESLPRDRIVSFLEQFGPFLQARYLEHVISELDDTTSTFHDDLIRFYVNQVKQGSPTTGEMGRSTTQHKLEDFLRASRHYDKNAMLRNLPNDDPRFYESRAIILSKLSFHKEALRVYVYQIRDHRKAEEYCNQTYLNLMSSVSGQLDPDDSHVDRAQSIYTTLLSLYLSPPPPHEQNLAQALEVLSLHGSRLPALSTLAALPIALPIKELESYFRTRMRAANSIARENAVMASLSNVEKLSCESQLLLGNDISSGIPKITPAYGRNRRVVLGEYRLCNVCNKRFGRSAARVFPDGEVLHYGCSDRRYRTEAK